MADTNSTVDTLITRENELTSSLGKVAPFAYTQSAYNNNDYAGVDSYAYAQEQNIPSSDPTVLTTNATVLNKGVRGQASSLPRMLLNHFFGRTSYNLNKIHDFFKTFLTAFKTHLAQDCNLYSATNTYHSGDVCFILDTVNGAPSWRVFRCVNTSASGIVNQPPVIGGVVQTLNWVECKYLTSMGEAYGIANLDASAKLHWNELPIDLLGQKRNKRVILIGDSYGINYTSGGGSWTGWGYLFAQLYPEIQTYVGAVGGAGFVSNAGGANFYDIIVSLYGSVLNKETITDIVVLGGYNDMSIGATEGQIQSAIGAFMDYCRLNYPNAQVTVGMISVDYNDADRQLRLNTTAMQYKNAVDKYGGRSFDNFKFILRNKRDLYFADGDANSGFHPNTSGNTQVAQYLHEYLMNGYFDVIKGVIQAGAFVYFRNGDIDISLVPADYPVVGLSMFMSNLLDGKIVYPNTELDLGDVTNASGDNLLWGARPENTATWCLPVINTSVPDKYQMELLICKLVNKHIFVKNIYSSNILYFNDWTHFKLGGTGCYHFYAQTIY